MDICRFRVKALMCLCGPRYSTMDNVDGKQARRTGQSSGLGELFEYVRTFEATMDVLLNVDQSRNRLSELYTRKLVRNGCFSLRTDPERSLHRTDSLFAHVLFHVGDLSHPHSVSGILQRPDRYGGLFTSPHVC